MKTIIPFCLTLIILIGSAEMSKSAEPINGFCLSGTQYSHLPIAGKCSASYEKGDYETALREFKPLAEQGNAAAQNNLGGLYEIGQGVLKDYVYAHMWLSIAAISAEGMNASKYRDIVAERRDFVAKQMTPSQLEKAQDLARECVRKKYKGC